MQQQQCYVLLKDESAKSWNLQITSHHNDTKKQNTTFLRHAKQDLQTNNFFKC